MVRSSTLNRASLLVLIGGRRAFKVEACRVNVFMLWSTWLSLMLRPQWQSLLSVWTGTKVTQRVTKPEAISDLVDNSFSVDFARVYGWVGQDIKDPGLDPVDGVGARDWDVDRTFFLLLNGGVISKDHLLVSGPSDMHVIVALPHVSLHHSGSRVSPSTVLWRTSVTCPLRRCLMEARPQRRLSRRPCRLQRPPRIRPCHLSLTTSRGSRARRVPVSVLTLSVLPWWRPLPRRGHRTRTPLCTRWPRRLVRARPFRLRPLRYLPRHPPGRPLSPPHRLLTAGQWELSLPVPRSP